MADTRTCDADRYLCAVGQASDRSSADINARAELSRIFESQVQSVARSYASAAQTVSNKTGENWLESQQFTQQAQVNTDKALRMTQIIGRWEEAGIHNSLVAIDRRKAGSELRELIQAKDEIISAQVAKAQDADAVARLRHARTAIEAFVGREVLNSDLRVIRADGRGIPAPVTMADLLGLLDDAAQSLTLGIGLAGGGAERVQACLEEALNNRGFQIGASEADEMASDIDVQGTFDVLIKGQLRAQELGQVGRSQVVQVSLVLRLINGQNGRILKTIRGRQKGTRRTLEAAMSTAAYQLCRRQVPQMIKDIDRYFVR